MDRNVQRFTVLMSKFISGEPHEEKVNVDKDDEFPESHDNKYVNSTSKHMPYPARIHNNKTLSFTDVTGKHSYMSITRRYHVLQWL